MKPILLLMALVSPVFADIGGLVLDARGGEPLARVRIRLAGTGFETATGPTGRFAIPGVPPGDYVLHVETVGYRLVKQPFTLEQGHSQHFEIILSPETFQRTDSVEVTSGPFDIEAVSSPSALNLTGSEVQNLSGVLMDDPIRAVQALPGVSANNDFQSRFALRGTGYEYIGLYIDDVLMHAPFHAVGNNQGDASLSILNGEMVAEMVLYPTSYPSRFGDRIGGILALRTRDGTKSKPSIRAAAGVAGAGILAEAPFANGRGSWIASARKSYLQYLIDKLGNDSALGLGFTDLQAKASYAVTGRNTVSIYVLDGNTALDRSSARNRSGVNALIDGSTRSSLVKSAWQFAPSGKLLVNATGAFLRERFQTLNRYERPIDFGFYGEWVGGASGAWHATPRQALDAGWNIRRLRDQGSGFRYLNDAATVLQFDPHRGNALRQGGYLDYTWQTSDGRFRGNAGVRLDAHDFFPGVIASPQAGFAARLIAKTDVQLAWGQYVQFPELAITASVLGSRRLLPERANHYTAAVEHSLAGDTRIRFEAWNRDDRDLIAEPLYDLRLVNDRVVLPVDANFYNSVRGYSRGVEFMIQRRTANRLSGWISYTFSYARQRDGIEHMSYWAVHDQRHLASGYLSYRVTPSLNLSGRWAYGSGEPMPGFLARRDGVYYLSPLRNNLRMPSYQRVDLRANKSFTYDRWKLTLYGEIINLADHDNLRFVSFDGANTATNRAYVTIDRVFPIVPVAGVTLEF